MKRLAIALALYLAGCGGTSGGAAGGAGGATVLGSPGGHEVHVFSGSDANVMAREVWTAIADFEAAYGSPLPYTHVYVDPGSAAPAVYTSGGNITVGIASAPPYLRCLAKALGDLARNEAAPGDVARGENGAAAGVCGIYSEGAPCEQTAELCGDPFSGGP